MFFIKQFWELPIENKFLSNKFKKLYSFFFTKKPKIWFELNVKFCITMKSIDIRYKGSKNNLKKKNQSLFATCKQWVKNKSWRKNDFFFVCF